MNSSLTPKLIDSFLEVVVDLLPDTSSSGVPCTASLSRAWQEIGLRPGDIVLLCLPNGREVLSQFFGVLLAGGVPALVAPMTPAVRLLELSKAMGARAIGALRLPTGDFGCQSCEAIGNLKIAMLPEMPEPIAAPGEVIVLSSGTSGFASGCVFDLEALLLNGERHAVAIGQRKEDTVLINLPLYFSFALVAQALASLTVGNRLIISGPPFNGTLYQKIVKEQEVTISSLTPVLIRSILQSDASYLEKLRVLTVGGDTLEAESVGRLVKIRPNRELYLTYGLTQAGPRVATLAAHDEPPHRYGSVGLPLKGTSVYLRPAANVDGLNQLYVTSETVMKRSIGWVEGRTHHDLVAPQSIATGDAFEEDAEGYLYFKGRLGDYISRKGEKISLAAVRRLVSQLPHVVSAKTMVVGHRENGEDFDLELRMDGSMELPEDPREMLRGLLRRTEMPRNIRIETTNEVSIQGYK
jgi:acyl-CoA synthetase (AMP-forming)/AMP-acid ligase II